MMFPVIFLKNPTLFYGFKLKKIIQSFLTFQISLLMGLICTDAIAQNEVVITSPMMSLIDYSKWIAVMGLW